MPENIDQTLKSKSKLPLSAFDSRPVVPEPQYSSTILGTMRKLEEKKLLSDESAKILRAKDKEISNRHPRAFVF